VICSENIQEKLSSATRSIIY